MRFAFFELARLESGDPIGATEALRLVASSPNDFLDEEAAQSIRTAASVIHIRTPGLFARVGPLSAFRTLHEISHHRVSVRSDFPAGRVATVSLVK
jgi:hypothetical protein